MKIIVGTDLTENARKAVTAAVVLAARWKDSVEIVHVASPFFQTVLSGEAYATLASSLSQCLHSEVERLANSGVEARERMLSGTPDHALAGLAGKNHARLLVVASHDRRDNERVSGGTAERIVQRSPVPALVVHSPEPFEAWTQGERPLRIFIAFDFTEASCGALRWAKHLAEAGPCEIVVGHVALPVDENARLGLTPGANPPLVQAVLHRELRERAEAESGGRNVRVRCECTPGPPGPRLLEMAEEEHADLLLVGMHQRHGLSRLWHPSISRSLLRRASLNLLCIPGALHEPTAIHCAKIRRVLVGVDFSSHTERTISQAFGVAPPGATVRLLHVLRPPGVPVVAVASYPEIPVPENAQEIEDARRRLRELIPEDATTRGISAEAAVLGGIDAGAVIRRTAERFGADIICLGSHGHSAVATAFIGSVAKDVAAHSARPVLLVPPAAERGQSTYS